MHHQRDERERNRRGFLLSFDFRKKRRINTKKWDNLQMSLQEFVQTLQRFAGVTDQGAMSYGFASPGVFDGHGRDQGPSITLGDVLVRAATRHAPRGGSGSGGSVSGARLNGPGGVAAYSRPIEQQFPDDYNVRPMSQRTATGTGAGSCTAREPSQITRLAGPGAGAGAEQPVNNSFGEFADNARGGAPAPLAAHAPESSRPQFQT